MKCGLHKKFCLLLILLCLQASLVSAQDLNIGPGLKGAWYNPATPGQGLFLEVYEDPPYFFAAWFSFPRPSEAAGTDPIAHRWYTLEGPYAGDAVEVGIFQTTGGAFADDAPVTQEQVGTAVIHFSDCNNGEIIYEFEDGSEQGSLPIARVIAADDSECGSLIQPSQVPEEIPKSRATVFQDVSVITMPEAGIKPHQMVVVENGVINYVGAVDNSRIPGNAVIIDGQSRYLMPGMVDAHTHLAEIASPASANTTASKELMLYLANGVTTILNNGDGNGAVIRWGNNVESGQMAGPAIYSAKFVFSQAANAQLSVKGEADARFYVQTAFNNGYRFMKIFEGVPRNLVLVILDEAARLGMPVIGHFQTTMPPEESLDNGLDLVAHVSQYTIREFNNELDESLIPGAIEVTLRNGASVTATLLSEELKALVYGSNEEGIAQYWAMPGLRYIPAESIAFTENQILRWDGGGAPGGYDDTVEFNRKLTRDLNAAGIRILLGTDAPSTLAVPGFSAHWEIQALLRSGISLGDVLKIASWNAGEYISNKLGLTVPFGSVRQGYRADLVLLESNPLASADNLKQITGVMAGGRWRSHVFFDRELASMERVAN